MAKLVRREMFSNPLVQLKQIDPTPLSGEQVHQLMAHDGSAGEEDYPIMAQPRPSHQKHSSQASFRKQQPYRSSIQVSVPSGGPPLETRYAPANQSQKTVSSTRALPHASTAKLPVADALQQQQRASERVAASRQGCSAVLESLLKQQSLAQREEQLRHSAEAMTKRMMSKNGIETKTELEQLLSRQSNPVIARNIDHVMSCNTMDAAELFDKGPNGKSTQGVPIEAFLRMNQYKSDRKKNDEAQRTWIRRNKHQIQLKSIMNRGAREGASSQFFSTNDRASSLDGLRDSSESHSAPRRYLTNGGSPNQRKQTVAGVGLGPNRSRPQMKLAQFSGSSAYTAAGPGPVG